MEELIDDYKYKRYTLICIDGLNTTLIAEKVDMSYGFYIKHNMHAVEWKLNAMIYKNKNLINNFDRNWRHILNRKFESYRA